MAIVSGMHPADRLRGLKSIKLQGKTIVLGVTGSIAAVECVKLAHELIRHGAEVHVVLTRSATEILHPNALQYATGNPVVTQITGSMEYLQMCGRDGKADLLLIAPCTSNTISKIAQGIDDSTVTTYAANALGSGIPILVAPAAHESMMDNPAVAANVRRLQELRIQLVEPKREEEKAKMADVETIVAHVIRRLGPKDLVDMRVLVVAGSTVEPIADVRVVTNRSTGGTGIELAKVAFEHGANVELGLGRHETPVPPWLPFKAFETTADLVSMAEKADADVCVVPAAVSDFTPAKKQSGKIPSRDGVLSLDLQPTPKVLNRFRKGAKKALVGFKAEAGVSETELKARAMALVKEADVDFVVANDISKVKGDTTSITIFARKGRAETFDGSKARAAAALSTALALDDALGSKVPRDELVAIAHETEVEYSTGLGDVVPASLGGMDLRLKPGAPAHAEVRTFPVEADLLLAVIGPEMPTKTVLRDPTKVAAINRIGGALVDEFSRGPTLERLFELGARFAEGTGLADKRVLEVIRASRMFGRATMAMLGNSVVATGNREQLATLYLKFGTLQRCGVDNEGARVL